MIQPGDIILVQNKFNWRKFNTWLIPLIHAGQNVSTWWGLTGPWFPYHHAMIATKHAYWNQTMYFEAAERCRFMPLDVLHKYKKIKVLKLNPDIATISEAKLYRACTIYVGRVYDYRGVLVDQLIRYLSELLFNIFSLGRNKGACLKVHRSRKAARKRTYCSEVALEVLNMSLGFTLFDAQHYSPKDIYELTELGIFKAYDYDPKRDYSKVSGTISSIE